MSDEIKEVFEEYLEREGCGYYPICREHDCPCKLCYHVQPDERTWKRVSE